MSKPLEVEQFKGQVDGNVPLFNRDPGWLKTLMNMRVRPGKYCEARAGSQALKPSGGTTAAIDSTGIIAGMHEHYQTHGAAIAYDASGGLPAYSTDIGQFSSYYLFGIVTSFAVPPVLSTNVVNNAWNFGSSSQFSRLRFDLSQGTGGTHVVVWEYSKAGGTFGTLTGLTEDFKTSGVKEISWAIPSDWAPNSAINNIYLYWVRVRITTAAVAASLSYAVNSAIRSDWLGRRMLFGAATTSSSGSANGKVRYYSQDSGGVALWNDAFVGATTLYSGNNPRYRFATFQNRLLFVNGVDNKRYNNDRANDLGLAAPSAANLTITPAGAANQFVQAAIFDYGITFGYGDQSLWGESNVFMSVTGPTPFTGVQQAQLAWNSGGAITSQVSEVHVYRTDDLTGVPASARNNQPMYRIATLPNTSPGFITLAYNDYTYGFPFPSHQLEIGDGTPPPRCKFVKVLQERVLLGSNDQFPSRFWWSEVGNGESFPSKDENFADLSYTGGGGITGFESSFNTMFAWTENAMIGATDLDEDIPNIYEVPGGVGSVAPDAVAAGYGVLIWLSRDGVYLMTRDGQIRRISDEQTETFGSMSVETHGGSRAIMHNSMYEVHLLDPNGAPVGSAPRWRFDLLNPGWSQSSLTLSPLALITAPLGHADEGKLHPIYGNVNPAVSDRTPYVGEYTTADSGTGYDCIADIHFGPPKMAKFKPRRVAAYYQADAGWGTPAISAPPGASYIFSPSPSYGTVVPQSGTDYKLAIANATAAQSGSQDIVVRFKATTVDGGTEHDQRLIAAYLDGEMLEIHPTG